MCMHAHRPGQRRALLLACPPSSSPSAPAKTSYNVILLVVVGDVLPQGPDDDHAEDACRGQGWRVSRAQSGLAPCPFQQGLGRSHPNASHISRALLQLSRGYGQRRKLLRWERWPQAVAFCQGGKSHAIPVTGNAFHPWGRTRVPSHLTVPQQFRRGHRHSASLVLSPSR